VTPSLLPVVAIVGPTAVGKTEQGVLLASAYRGEIVSADSRQIYRFMDIGTGKPSPLQRAQVSHHLLDIVKPDEEFSVAHYQETAAAAIADIHRRGKFPFLVGGSGQYVWALLQGFRLPQVPPNEALRKEMAAIAEEESGVDWLFAQLQEADPIAARRIDPRNVRRVIRAIEVTRATGVPFSQVGKAEPPPYRTMIIGLTALREELYRRVDARVDAMLEAGWLDEVRRLLEMGFDPKLPALSSLGYGELIAHLRGEADLAAATAKIKQRTRRYAAHQYTWFRLIDERITWFDITKDGQERIAEAVAKFLGQAC
jgi:tRNA dimethylallyltransferase